MYVKKINYIGIVIKFCIGNNLFSLYQLHIIQPSEKNIMTEIDLTMIGTPEFPASSIIPATTETIKTPDGKIVVEMTRETDAPNDLFVIMFPGFGETARHDYHAVVAARANGNPFRTNVLRITHWDGTSLAESTRGVIATLQTLHPQPRVVVWGRSFGALPAVELVRQLPQGAGLGLHLDVPAFSVNCVGHQALRNGIEQYQAGEQTIVGKFKRVIKMVMSRFTGRRDVTDAEAENTLNQVLQLPQSVLPLQGNVPVQVIVSPGDSLIASEAAIQQSHQLTNGFGPVHVHVYPSSAFGGHIPAAEERLAQISERTLPFIIQVTTQ